MTLSSRLRANALLCAILFVLCELVCRPAVQLGIADDWSYIRTVQVLAQTGHIVYNGWATAMLGWQLYLAAALVHIAGFSFTAVRMSTLLVGAVTAFLTQRTFVRAGISERNAVIGTLAVVLSPIYMMLSVTFMTDIGGMLAVVSCLYCCLRALEAPKPSSAAAWVSFAALTNGIFGTSRQIAWLGVLVMVPCTIWLLRRSRRVVVVGTLAMFAGWSMVALTLYWFAHQPYALAEPLLVKIAGLHEAAYMVRELVKTLLEVPLLLLTLTLAFLPQVRRCSRRTWAVISVVSIGYALLAIHLSKAHGATAMLQPLIGDWLGPEGFYHYPLVASFGPLVLGLGVRIALTVLSLGGLVGVVAFLLYAPKKPLPQSSPERPGGTRASWGQLGFLFIPFLLVYFALLIPRSRAWVLDRYLLEFALIGAICLTRAYQEFIAPALPPVTTALVALVGLAGIGCTHDMFAAYRARLALVRELQAAGVADNTVDGGFEYNYDVELEHAGHINDERLTNPPHTYVSLDPYRGLTCDRASVLKTDSELTPEDRFYVETAQKTDPRLRFFKPRYGVAYQPNACRGPAPVAPVTYLRWLGLKDTTLYAVRYGPR